MDKSLNTTQIPESCLASVSGSTFINADCFDVFPFIEDKSIDAIICDLPYGTTNCKWDSILPFDKLWVEYKRIIKDNGAIVLFGNEPFSTMLRLSNLKEYKYDWIWEKNIPTGQLQAKYAPMKLHENIIVFNKHHFYPIKEKRSPNSHSYKSGKKYKMKSEHYEIDRITTDRHELRNPTNILKYDKVHPSKSLHPTQKPIELMEYLVKTYTNEGDMVLDNTMGSGTTILAAIKNNRIGIGIEKEKQYYDVAVRRASEYCH